MVEKIKMKRLNIVHIVASDVGGAYRAAKRINDALINIGENSEIIVLEQKNDHSKVIPYFKKKYLLFAFKCFRKLLSIKLNKIKLAGQIYECKQGVNILSMPQIRNADVINLHWINDGMISYKHLKKMCAGGKVLVWTMHDMFPFTSACYYDKECGGYKQNCSYCPIVKNIKNGQKYIDYMYKKKNDAYSKGAISFVGCSRWITMCAEESTLLEGHYITNIANPIELEIFRPLSPQYAFSYFPIIKNDYKKIILFGAMSSTSDERKGYNYLLNALRLFDNKSEYKLVIFGAEENYALPIEFECVYIGNVNNDEALASLYSLADVFVAPSIQENLSNSVLESLACGTPVVAFDIGGMKDMIEHKKTGYLVKAFDVELLSEGIIWSIDNSIALQNNCREKVSKEFSLNIIGLKYMKLYNERIYE